MIRELSAPELATLGRSVCEVGIAEVPNFICAGEIAVLADCVRRLASGAVPRYFSLAGTDAFPAGPLAELVQAAATRRLLGDIHAAIHGTPASRQPRLPVLRVVAGRTGRRQSQRFHFDAHSVSVLLPILIPREGRRRGELVLYPRLRRPTTSALRNAAQKAMLQNPLAWRLFSRSAVQRRLGARVVPLSPGSLYAFDGFTSYHANAPCDAGTLRATLLLHLEDRFADNAFFALVRRRRFEHEREVRLA